MHPIQKASGCKRTPLNFSTLSEGDYLAIAHIRKERVERIVEKIKEHSNQDINALGAPL